MTASIDRATLAALLGTVLIWGSAFAGIGAALEGYGPGQLALLRFAVASLALAAMLPFRPARRRPSGRDLPGLLALGLIGITLYNLFLNTGQTSVTAGGASILIVTAPVFTAILARLALGERLTLRGWLGIAVSFAGAALVGFGEGDRVRFERGALWVLAAALVTSAYFVFQKPYLRRYPALDVVTWTIWAGTACLLVFAPGLAEAVRAASWRATAAALYLGLFPSAVGYALLIFALSRAPAGPVTTFLFLQPVVGVTVAWLWLGEIPPPLALAGGAVTLAGVALVVLRGRPEADPARDAG